MEDDLVFIPGWYSTLIKAMRSSRCGLLSGFRYFFGHVSTRSINPVVEEVFSGYTGGQLMIASRDFFHACPAVFENDITTIWNNDDFWIDHCRRVGLKFGVVKQSVCQHIGFCTESGQKAFVKDGKLLKIDPAVRGIVVGDSVARFRLLDDFADKQKAAPAREGFERQI
jgi:hypothetical protein